MLHEEQMDCWISKQYIFGKVFGGCFHRGLFSINYYCDSTLYPTAAVAWKSPICVSFAVSYLNWRFQLLFSMSLQNPLCNRDSQQNLFLVTELRFCRATMYAVKVMPYWFLSVSVGTLLLHTVYSMCWGHFVMNGRVVCQRTF